MHSCLCIYFGCGRLVLKKVQSSKSGDHPQTPQTLSLSFPLLFVFSPAGPALSLRPVSPRWPTFPLLLFLFFLSSPLTTRRPNLLSRPSCPFLSHALAGRWGPPVRCVSHLRSPPSPGHGRPAPPLFRCPPFPHRFLSPP
jgi:hypothetical protein